MLPALLLLMVLSVCDLNCPKCLEVSPETSKCLASQEAPHIAAVLPDTRTGTPVRYSSR